MYWPSRGLACAISRRRLMGAVEQLVNVCVPVVVRNVHGPVGLAGRSAGLPLTPPQTFTMRLPRYVADTARVSVNWRWTPTFHVCTRVPFRSCGISINGVPGAFGRPVPSFRSEEHTSELQSRRLI